MWRCEAAVRFCGQFTDYGFRIGFESPLRASRGARILRHAQVVEDEAGTEAEFAHHCGDGLRGFLGGFADAHRKATQPGDVRWAVVGADTAAAAIFIVASVDDVMEASDAPMRAVDGRYALR